MGLVCGRLYTRRPPPSQPQFHEYAQYQTPYGQPIYDQVTYGQSTYGPSPLVYAEAQAFPNVRVEAQTLSGLSVMVEVSPSTSVRHFQKLLAFRFGVAEAEQVRVALLSSGVVLTRSSSSLASYGLTTDTVVAVVLGPPTPEWAAMRGFSADHPATLSDYHIQHELDEPEFLASADATWSVFSDMLDKEEASRHALTSYNSSFELARDGQAAATIYAKPGETLALEAQGHIWNHQGNSCIHQLLLVLDKEIVAELSDGIPGRGRKFRNTFCLTAPQAPGVYMFWKNTQLQYNMRDARRSLERDINDRVGKVRYPDAFVGWLIVE